MGDAEQEHPGFGHPIDIGRERSLRLGVDEDDYGSVALSDDPDVSVPRQNHELAAPETHAPPRKREITLVRSRIDHLSEPTQTRAHGLERATRGRSPQR